MKPAGTIRMGGQQATGSMPNPAFPELGGNWQGNNAGFASPAHMAAPGPPGDQSLPPPLPGEPGRVIRYVGNADPFMCLVGICGCSLVITIQSIVECDSEFSKGCRDEYGYAVALGVMSFFISLLIIAMSCCADALFKQFSPVIAVFFMIWWGLGA